MSDSQIPEDPADENIRQLLAHFHQSEQARLEQAKAKLRAEILPALAQHRVANVEAAYSGYGDSGAIDGVQYRDKSGVLVDREKIPATLTISTGRVLPVRFIGEQHVLEDLGRIPTVADWLGKIQPESWMLGRCNGLGSYS